MGNALSTFINVERLNESKEEEQEQNIEGFKIMIESMEKKLKEFSSSQSCYDIYRVPRQLYELKPEAYTAQSVSIGPLHLNVKQLRIMETQKLHYVYRLLKRSGKTFEFCVEALSGLEEEARKRYSDTMNLGKSEFLKMMVVDSCFILEFLEEIRRKENGHFTSNDSYWTEITTDLIKLENQLPLFSLEHLFALLVEPYLNFSLNWYIYLFLIGSFAGHLNCPILSRPEELESILRASAEGRHKHFLDFLRCMLIPSPLRVIPPNEKYVPLPCNASELKSAGVKFRKKEKASLFDINFDTKSGVLTIPTLKIFGETEIVLRNLIAFEQDRPCNSRYFSAYATFMDNLIDTAKDVTLLTQKGIIENNLGSPEDVMTIFNNIVKHVVNDSPYFTSVTKDLTEYYNKTCNRRMANLRQTYFNTPWAGISVAAAVFIIILTVIQTICSILQTIK